MSRRLLATLVAAVALLATATACGSSDSPTDDSRVQIVASTDVYGAVATAVAGPDATVTTLFANPSGDPHEYEPSAADSAKIADATIVVVNGGGYDQYLVDAKHKDGATVVDAYALAGGKGNEHVFYNLAAVKSVATAIGEALATKDEAHAATYRANATSFGTRIDAQLVRLAQLKKDHAAERVAQTEPLAAYLLADAGLDDATPPALAEAVEEGHDAPAAAVAATRDLLTGRQVRALVFNAQTKSALTEQLSATAREAGVAVVPMTETLPEGVTDYVEWQTANITALAAALGTT